MHSKSATLMFRPMNLFPLKLALIACQFAGSVAAAPAQQPERKPGVEYPSPLIREEQQVPIDGGIETWRLQWKAKPDPYCEPSDVSLTCPCMGFAYGEIGGLLLVRLRNGSEIDRLDLTPLFGEEPGAAIQKWAPDLDRDFHAAENDTLDQSVQKRPIVQVMNFADYDHDGAATEFYLQTEVAPCGKSLGVLIGTSKSNPHLHAFGTNSHTATPISLFKWEWDALLQSRKPAEVTEWECGDHGTHTRTAVQLRWNGDNVEGVSRKYTCPQEGEQPTLIEQKPL